MKHAKVGDKIKCMGLLVTVGKLFYEDYDRGSGKWDIEFLDTKGQYRHWKQAYDGGEFIPA